MNCKREATLLLPSRYLFIFFIFFYSGTIAHYYSMPGASAYIIIYTSRNRLSGFFHKPHLWYMPGNLFLQNY